MKDRVKDATMFAGDLCDLMVIDRTSPYSPTGHGDFYARLRTDLFKGSFLCVTISPVQLRISIADYGMSSTHLDTIDVERIPTEQVRQMSFEDLVSAIMQVIARNRKEEK